MDTMSQEESNTASPEPSSNKVGFDKLKIIRNAFANVARGGTGALVTIALPPFLTRILSQDAYGTWLLILQLSAYVGFLDFGIQTAVGRFVAHTNELQDFKQRDSIVSTSLAILTGSGLLAMLGLIALAWQLPQLFRGMPQALHHDARIALLFVGGSLAISLPFSVFGGVFVGIQRYDIPAWIIGVSKLFGGVLAVLLAQSTHSIAWMGAGIAITTIGGAFGQYFAYQNIAGNIKVLISLISKRAGQEIASYCFGISIWTLGMLLVSGLDIAIVGFFDYKSVAYYTLAVSLTNFIIQLQNAMFGVLIPSAAILGAREDKVGLGQLLMNSTRYGMLILLFTGIPLVIGAKWILNLWIGAEYASHTAIILQVLVLANIVRLSGLPYATLVIAVGQQRLILLSPMVEGISNFLLSIVLTSFIGSVGAAIGTLFGGFISIGFHFVYNMNHTTNILINRKALARYGILNPILCGLPSLVPFIIIWLSPELNISILVPIFVTSIIASLALLWKIGLKSSERNKLASYIYSHS
jgi:O-antigen/teichoic acid export membrane protein